MGAQRARPKRFRDRVATGRSAERVALAAGAFALGLLFHAGLLFGGSLHNFDWLVHWHYYDWVHTSLQQYGTLPLFMADPWHTSNFVANAQSPVLGPLVWLLAWLPTDVYVKLLIALYTAIGCLGSYLLARDLGARPLVAAGAMLTWSWSGFFAAQVSIGHHWILGVNWLPVLLLLVRRAIAGSRSAWLAAAVVEALPLLEGQHHPFLWQNLFLGLWAMGESLRRRDARALLTLGGVALVGAALAGIRVVPLVFEFADYAPPARIAGLPLSALGFSLLARGQGPQTLGFGIDFAHGAGWWEYAFYLGVPGLCFVAVGTAALDRRGLPLLAAGLVALLLALDTRALGFDLWQTFQQIPVLRSQRSPSRLLVLALFAWSMAAAIGWERLLSAVRPPAARTIAVLLLLLTLGIGLDLWSQARPWQRAALGAPQIPRPHTLGPPTLLRPGGLEVLEEAPNRVRYRVRSERPELLVFRFLADAQGGWRPERWPIVPTLSGHFAVGVPAGEHEVTLSYRPRGWRAGLALSLAALLGILLASPPGNRTLAFSRMRRIDGSR